MLLEQSSTKHTSLWSLTGVGGELRGIRNSASNAPIRNPIAPTVANKSGFGIRNDLRDSFGDVFVEGVWYG